MPKGKRPAENSVKVNCKTKTSYGLLRALVPIELCKVNHKGYKELT